MFFIFIKFKEEKVEEERRLLESQKNNISDRALKQMMGGTLEKRSEGDDEFHLETPDWMAGDPSTFSEDQLKEVVDWKKFSASSSFRVIYNHCRC